MTTPFGSGGRLWLAFSLCLALAGCSSTTTQPNATQACEALVLDYAYYRDREDLQQAAAGVAGLFTQDATLTVNDQSFQGREAIFERIANQRDAPLTAHMMSTIRIFSQSSKRATGVSYATVYVAAKRGQNPVTAASFTAVGEYHDEFVLTPEGWRIAKRKFITRIAPVPAAG